MSLFIFLCAGMLAAALVLVARPLLRFKAATPTLFVVAPLAIALSVALYFQVGHRTWERDQTLAQARAMSQQDLAASIERLETLVREQPNDVDAVMSLAEALVQQDERAIAGRAGELFERALAHAPTNPRALWYGAISALTSGRLAVARERLQLILAQNPPENIRSIIERQIQDIGQQLGDKPPAAGHALKVQVSLAPSLVQGVDKSTALFVLARDPANPGPPLAVARKSVADLPLTVTLTDNDAMMAGHGINSVNRVQVVARISKSGAPQAQAGDLYGEALVEFKDTQPVAITIVIDHKVEK